jgi:hypothetical protein
MKITLDFNPAAGYNIHTVLCRCDGMADVTDSKSVDSDIVRVQVSPPAPKFKGSQSRCTSGFGGFFFFGQAIAVNIICSFICKHPS